MDTTCTCKRVCDKSQLIVPVVVREDEVAYSRPPWHGCVDCASQLFTDHVWFLRMLLRLLFAFVVLCCVSLVVPGEQDRTEQVCLWCRVFESQREVEVLSDRDRELEGQIDLAESLMDQTYSARAWLEGKDQPTELVRSILRSTHEWVRPYPPPHVEDTHGWRYYKDQIEFEPVD